MFAPAYFARSYFPAFYFAPVEIEEPPVVNPPPQIGAGGSESGKYSHQLRTLDDDEVALIVALLGSQYL